MFHSLRSYHSVMHYSLPRSGEDSGELAALSALQKRRKSLGPATAAKQRYGEWFDGSDKDLEHTLQVGPGFLRLLWAVVEMAQLHVGWATKRALLGSWGADLLHATRHTSSRRRSLQTCCHAHSWSPQEYNREAPAPSPRMTRAQRRKSLAVDQSLALEPGLARSLLDRSLAAGEEEEEGAAGHGQAQQQEQPPQAAAAGQAQQQKRGAAGRRKSVAATQQVGMQVRGLLTPILY